MTSTTIKGISITTKISQIAITIIASAALPYAFHFFGINGGIFLPMYATILISSFLINSSLIYPIAILTPLANHVITGMPPFYPLPILQILTLELGILCFSSKLLRKTKLPFLLSTSIAVIVARLSSLIFVALPNNVSFTWWSNQILISLPGVILNVLIGFFLITLLKKKTL